MSRSNIFLPGDICEGEEERLKASDDEIFVSGEEEEEEADKMGVKRKRKQIKRDVKRKMIKFEEGQVVELKHLLFTEDRDYLIKYNSKQLVNADQLANKVIVLYFVSLHPKNNSWDLETADLVDIYIELQSKGLPFEVVFVPVWDAVACSDQDAPRKRYEEIFSFMPWTAIPLSDAKCCEHLSKSYDYYGNSYYHPGSVVISESGVVCQHNAITLFSSYGSAGYPFNKEKIQALKSEEDKAKEHPSVTALLGDSPDGSYVINNKGDKIPVTSLESKVVALFFYQEGCTDYLTTELEKAYNLAPKPDFEVVLIYIHDSSNTRFVTDETSFNETFAKMPWLALPFKDSRCKKVQRVFEYPLDYEYDDHEPDLSLVIIGPHGKFCEPFGAEILRKFGSLAYPFTRKRAIQCQADKAKKMKLDMFFCQETVFASIDGSNKIRFSELKGKRIIVFFDDPVYKRHDMFLKELEERYLRDKGTLEDFEVIHILFGKTRSSVPWLTHPPFDKGSNAENCLRDVFPSKSGLVAFTDGTVVRVTENPNWPMDIPFPFSYGDFEVDVEVDLLHRFKWILFGMTDTSPSNI